MQNISDARAARADLLDRAARGEDVTIQQLRDADDSVRRAESDDALAAAVAASRVRQQHEAAIEALRARAEALSTALRHAIDGAAEAAAALDAAMMPARAAADRFTAAMEMVVQLDREAHRFNGIEAEAAAAANPVLAALPPGTAPRAETCRHGGATGFGEPVRAELVQCQRYPGRALPAGQHDNVLTQSPGDIVRIAAGRLAPPA